MSKTTKITVSDGGISFFGLLAIVLITLKLTNYITWSWWIVLSPIFLPLVFGLMVAAGFILVMLIILICSIAIAAIED